MMSVWTQRENIWRMVTKYWTSDRLAWTPNQEINLHHVSTSGIVHAKVGGGHTMCHILVLRTVVIQLNVDPRMG